MSSSTSPFLDPNRLLSVQSHVVSGYVGNRAATFPLQLLGYDVDVVNTVQFSNHTGYGHTNGHKTTPEQLDAVFKGLETNGLCRWSRCLTGYIPGAPALQAVGREIEKLKRRAKAQGEDVLYLLDPVMGDIGKGLYVAEDVVPIYRQLLSLASIITPNQFETELLSETKITSPRTLLQALQTLHSPPYNVEHVVISSIPLPVSLVEKLGLPLSSSAAPARYTSLLDQRSYGQAEEGEEAKETEDEILVCFASTRSKNPGDAPETYGYALPTIRGYYSGVGDLFSALVLGHYQDRRYKPQSPDAAKEEKEEKEEKEGESGNGSGRTLERAVSLALLGVQIVLLKTHLSTLPLNDSDDNDHNNNVGDLDCIPSDDELDKEDNKEDDKKDNKEDADDVEPLRRPARRARRMRLRELRVVQERRALMDLADDEDADGGGGWKGKRLDWDALLKEA